MSHESRPDGGVTPGPGAGDLRSGVRALRLIIAFNLLSTAVHYTHNFVMADMYPPVPVLFPTALSYQIGIAIFWPLLTALGLWGYWLYKVGETRRPRWMLSAYAMLGFTTLGHFMGGNPDIPPFFYVTLFTDFLAGSALLVFVAWTFEQPDPGEDRGDLATGTTRSEAR
jgi:hypothetical protein